MSPGQGWRQDPVRPWEPPFRHLERDGADARKREDNWADGHPHSTDEETEAVRAEGTCPRGHSACISSRAGTRAPSIVLLSVCWKPWAAPPVSPGSPSQGPREGGRSALGGLRGERRGVEAEVGRGESSESSVPHSPGRCRQITPSNGAVCQGNSRGGKQLPD